MLSDIYHTKCSLKQLVLCTIETLRKYRLSLIGALIGAGLGYLYYLKVGCVSGSCAITSSPINSSVYGAILAYLLVDMFRKSKKE